MNKICIAIYNLVVYFLNSIKEFIPNFVILSIIILNEIILNAQHNICRRYLILN